MTEPVYRYCSDAVEENMWVMWDGLGEFDSSQLEGRKKLPDCLEPVTVANLKKKKLFRASAH